MTMMPVSESTLPIPEADRHEPALAMAGRGVERSLAGALGEHCLWLAVRADGLPADLCGGEPVSLKGLSMFAAPPREPTVADHQREIKV